MDTSILWRHHQQGCAWVIIAAQFYEPTRWGGGRHLCAYPTAQRSTVYTDVPNNNNVIPYNIKELKTYLI